MMWSTDTLWFEVAIVSIVIALGHIALGHFEERTPRWRKLLKYVLALGLVLALSMVFGRRAALTVLGMLFIPVLYIHLVVLPRHGINGWTGAPKGRYYDYRKWDKDIFD
jgi:ABC-type Na+ efflux pump permease subunit